jgi:hypothetical protein
LDLLYKQLLEKLIFNFVEVRPKIVFGFFLDEKINKKQKNIAKNIRRSFFFDLRLISWQSKAKELFFCLNIKLKPKLRGNTKRKEIKTKKTCFYLTQRILKVQKEEV